MVPCLKSLPGLAAVALLGICGGVEPANFTPQIDVPTAIVADIECQSGGCLIVENPSEYCSIDPYELGEGAIFASKARLWIKPGAYPVSAKDALSDLAIRIKTRFGETSLSPAGEELFSIRRTEAEEENVDAATKRVEVKAAYVGDRLSLDRFFLRTSRSSDEKFRLGDPEDVGSFYAAGRNLYISV